MADVFVQWKGTVVCLDLNCLCGYHGHFDGDFAYFLRCGSCGRTYEMPHTFEVTPDETPEDDGPTRDVFAAERCAEREGPKVVEVVNSEEAQRLEERRRYLAVAHMNEIVVWLRANHIRPSDVPLSTVPKISDGWITCDVYLRDELGHRYFVGGELPKGVVSVPLKQEPPASLADWLAS